MTPRGKLRVTQDMAIEIEGGEGGVGRLRVHGCLLWTM